MSILDDKTIEITCPQCSHKFKERIGRLKTNPNLTCSRCRASIRVQADQLRKATESVDKKLADLKRSLGKIGK